MSGKKAASLFPKSSLNSSQAATRTAIKTDDQDTPTANEQIDVDQATAQAWRASILGSGLGSWQAFGPADSAAPTSSGRPKRGR